MHGRYCSVLAGRSPWRRCPVLDLPGHRFCPGDGKRENDGRGPRQRLAREQEGSSNRLRQLSALEMAVQGRLESALSLTFLWVATAPCCAQFNVSVLGTPPVPERQDTPSHWSDHSYFYTRRHYLWTRKYNSKR